jgi:hypothetical protein
VLETERGFLFLESAGNRGVNKMKYYLSALLSVAATTAFAGDYDSANPQIFQKNFEAMHYVERPYEVGRSEVLLQVDCLDSKEAVEQALNQTSSTIEGKVQKAAASLNLGEVSDTFGFKFDNKIAHTTGTPIQNPYNANGFKWVNRCTKAESSSPVRVKNVFSGSKVVTVWFPNDGEVLNHLTALVTDIEDLSDTSSTNGVRVKCATASGTNYDLAVTKTTEAAAWSEIEAVAKQRAREKVQSEFATVRYDNMWKGKEYFAQNQQTRLPYPSVVKEGGRWIAKFKDQRNYTVFVKQSAAPEGKPGQLTGTRTYGVEAEATATEGLYGTLNIGVNKDCEASQSEAETAVAKTGNTILDELRVLNNKQNSEGNRLKAGDATGVEYSPWVSFRQVRKPDGSVEQSFYNHCTLEVKQGLAAPLSKVWRGTMQIAIDSSDLDALATYRDKLTERHRTEMVDPNILSVSVAWNAKATLSVLENLAGQLETSSFDRFLDDKSEFRCESGNLSFACISTQREPVFSGGRRSLEGADASLNEESPGGGYTDGVTSNIDSSERGVATFRGKYVIEYTLRKVLLNNEAPVLP